jgi:hypothetical protein
MDSLAKEGKEKALQKAQTAWRVDSYYQNTGEYFKNPYYPLAYQYQAQSPIEDARFSQLVARFFGELWAVAQIDCHQD